MKAWGTIILGLMLWAACAPASSPPLPVGTRTIPHGSVDLVVIAMGDLAHRLDIHATQVSVAGVEVVDWPDASLGCPEAGMFYAQVITPGYRILLSAQGQTYQYHSDRTSRVVFCPPSPTAQP